MPNKDEEEEEEEEDDEEEAVEEEEEELEDELCELFKLAELSVSDCCCC